MLTTASCGNDGAMEPKQDTGMGMGQWSQKTLGEDVVAETPPEPQAIPEGAEQVTIADLLMRDDLEPSVREWLEMALSGGPAWIEEHSPPAWAMDVGRWEQAMDMAQQADPSDVYAFATLWYRDHLRGPVA